MVRDIGLAAGMEKIENTQWAMRLFSLTVDESRGYAEYVLITAVSWYNGVVVCQNRKGQ
ncbi:MAG: hypothetical protein HQL72_10295 [Magnetococcales bacterium]|nr:hypothetical protein [Magnetococcales bacterium]